METRDVLLGCQPAAAKMPKSSRCQRKWTSRKRNSARVTRTALLSAAAFAARMERWITFVVESSPATSDVCVCLEFYVGSKCETVLSPRNNLNCGLLASALTALKIESICVEPCVPFRDPWFY